MGLTVPAVHYSALASLPPDIVSSINQQHTPNIRLKLNQIFQKLLNHDHHTKPRNITTETIEEKENDPSIVLNNPNNNNSDDRTVSIQTSTKSVPSSVESLERLPFTEPYFSTIKTEQAPSELSIYHKHCVRQEKFIDQKRHHVESSYTKTDQHTKLISIFLFYQLRHATKENRTFNYSCKSVNVLESLFFRVVISIQISSVRTHQSQQRHYRNSRQ